MIIAAAVLTISDSAASGLREDVSGPRLRERLADFGWTTAVHEVVPDEAPVIAARVAAIAARDEISLLVTTGGTGVSARDVTPEAIRPILEREIPGFGELMRSEGLKQTPLAVLSRSFAGTLGTTLILCVPGSPKGAVESLDAVAHLIPHVTALLRGQTEHGDAKLKA